MAGSGPGQCSLSQSPCEQQLRRRCPCPHMAVPTMTSVSPQIPIVLGTNSYKLKSEGSLHIHSLCVNSFSCPHTQLQDSGI
jgi:hypothetical protein